MTRVTVVCLQNTLPDTLQQQHKAHSFTRQTVAARSFGSDNDVAYTTGRNRSVYDKLWRMN